MSNYAISLKRTSLLLAALAFTAALLVANFSAFGQTAGAAQLTSRSLVLSSTLIGTETTGAAGSETNGSAATHTYGFTLASAGNVGSVLVKYCTTAIGACTAPTGLDFASSTLSSESFTGTFAIDKTGLEVEDAECTGVNGLNNCIGVTNGTPASESGAHTIAIASVVNPTTLATFFARIAIYSDAAYTTEVHDGTVASSTTEGIEITSRVVETLGFSTTATDNATSEGASCAALGGSGVIQLGDVTEGTLSISQAYDAYSAFRLYTNAANGVVVQYEGSTLTKGSDTIDAAGATAAASTVGSEQFGLAVNLVGGQYQDDNAGFGGAGQLTIGLEYDGGNGTITNGGTATFAFVADTKTTMATATSYIDCDTAAVRYIGNISPLTPAGTYTTTIVYFAVPTY